MRISRNQKGFTIMELMIVIIIIGILIAIAVPAYNGFRARAAIAACDANQRTIESAAGIYFADTGGWPAEVSNVAPTYVATVPTCPSQGTYTIAAGVVSCDATDHN